VKLKELFSRSQHRGLAGAHKGAESLSPWQIHEQFSCIQHDADISREELLRIRNGLHVHDSSQVVNLLLDIDECPHRVQSPYRGSFGDQTLFDCSHPDRKAVNAQYGSCDVLDTVCPPVQNDGAEAILPEHKS